MAITNTERVIRGRNLPCRGGKMSRCTLESLATREQENPVLSTQYEGKCVQHESVRLKCLGRFHTRDVQSVWYELAQTTLVRLAMRLA